MVGAAMAHAPQPVKPFSSGMRSPIVAPLTRGLIGLPLVLLTTHTDKYFAWTIAPPITAAFLGANYWSSAILAVLASRERVWARGRISISPALAFAPLVTAATMMHIHKFHLGTFYGWFWVIAYAIYPPMLIVMLLRQLRTPGGDPPRTSPLPLWVRGTFGAQAVVLLPLGALMFAAPGVAQHLWPWPLTSLTSQALSAWVLAFGVLAAHALRENDLARVKVALLGYPVLVLLHIVALARFGSDLDWGGAPAWGYVAFLLSCGALGAYGVSRALGRPSRPRPSGSAAPRPSEGLPEASA